MTTETKKFFHTISQTSQIEKQGMVLSRDPKRMTVHVEFFSWMTGEPNGQQTFDEADTVTWRFYESKAAWNHAGDKVFA
jgi:hypothetical protein